MKRIVCTLSVLALTLLVAAPLAAEEKKKENADKGAKGEKGGASQLLAVTLKKLEKAELADDQVAKIKDIVAEYGAKLLEARKKSGMTKEQGAARKEAMEKAKADGLKGKEAQEAIAKALNLSDEQKAAMAQLSELQQGLNSAVLAVLTPEQREKAGIKAPATKGDKKPAKGEKKPAVKKPDADK